MKNAVEYEMYEVIKRFRKSLLKIHIGVLFAACLLVYACSTYFGARTAYDKEAQLCTAINAQAKQNISAFMRRMEDTAKLVMGNEDYVKYNAAKTGRDEYLSIGTENKMNDYLVNLSTLGNYTDFGMVYSNNHTVGKITDGTKDLYDDKIYDCVVEIMDGERTKWFTGSDNDYTRVYFAGRVNDNAIFLSSFFSTEFDSIFLNSSDFSDINSMLCDKDGRVIYADGGENKKGERINDEAAKLLGGDENITVKNMDMICSADGCADDWTVVTTVDMNKTMKYYMRTGLQCLGIFVGGALLLICLSGAATVKENPEKIAASGRFTKLDSVTGLYTAEHTENSIMDKIETCISGSTIALIIVKITNLDLIKLNYGEEVTEQAQQKIAKTLESLYGENDICGVLEEGKFVVFADFTDFDLVKAYNSVKSNLKKLNDTLKECCLDGDRGYIKCAVGAAVYPEYSDDYDELLSTAEKACEEAADASDGRFIVYGKREEEALKK